MVPFLFWVLVTELCLLTYGENTLSCALRVCTFLCIIFCLTKKIKRMMKSKYKFSLEKCVSIGLKLFLEFSFYNCKYSIKNCRLARRHHKKKLRKL